MKTLGFKEFLTFQTFLINQVISVIQYRVARKYNRCQHVDYSTTRKSTNLEAAKNL